MASASHHRFDSALPTFCNKYVPTVTVTVAVPEGVEVQVPLDDEAIGLALTELHQKVGDPDAVGVMESPSWPPWRSLAC